MAVAVQQPSSASIQSRCRYSKDPPAAVHLRMPGDAAVAPLTSTVDRHEPSPSLPDSSLSDLTNPFPGGGGGGSLSVKKRRASKGKIPAEIKRSASTPHMRSLAGVDGDSLSPTTDKKRNKLGYHRTSVACGHCRRRKIRCLPAPDDHQGRCSNCIRLKKECNFYPVDQEGQHSSQPKLAGGPKAPSASNPSSPRTVATSSHESVDDFNNYNTLSSNSNSSASRFVLSSDHEGSTTSSVGSGVIYQPAATLPSHIHPYGESMDDQWNPGFYAPTLNSDSRYDAPTAAYWQSHDPEATPAYGHDSKPALQYSQPRMGSVSSMAYTSADDSQTWSMPARSMSYGNLETLSQQQQQQQQYSHQQPGQHHHDYPDRPSVPYSHPQALGASGTITSTPVSGSMPASAVAHGLPYGYSQTWDSMYRAPGAGPEAALQGQAFQQPFYAEPVSLQQIKEENGPGAVNYYHHGPGSQIPR